MDVLQHAKSNLDGTVRAKGLILASPHAETVYELDQNNVMMEYLMTNKDALVIVLERFVDGYVQAKHQMYVPHYVAI